MDGLLKVLAWIADPPVLRQFFAWKQSGQTFPSLYIKPYLYSYEAGWELGSDGSRRQLYFDNALELIEPADEQALRKSSAIVGTPRPDNCGLCGNRLTNLLSLDLQDPRFNFLGLTGRRLNVPVCHACWGCTMARLDTNGNATWLSESTREFEAASDAPFWPADKYVLGIPARTPVQPVATGGSWVGGLPRWINDARFPPCPSCNASMHLLAHIDLYPLGGDGVVYAYLCRDCLVTATAFDCT
jgi:hypothetical protein